MKLADRYRTISDIPTVAPVFPLRGCILLPRAALPLNIFEPRYLDMFNEALAGNRLICIVQPARLPRAANDDGDDESEAESPQSTSIDLRTTGCLGRIMAFQELDDGRMIVSLAGVTRCTLETEIETKKTFRTFRVSADKFIDDLHLGQGEDAVPRDKLLVTLRRFLDARDLKADWAAIARSGSEALVNSLSVMSPYGPEEKQALLEANSLKARAEMLIALAEMELASSGGPSGSTLQ